MELREMIMELASRTGPSGFECRAAEKARELLEPFADEIRTDVLGNLIAVRRCGEANAPLVLLDAHMDEVGLIVTGYEGGFLRFSNIGGVDARILPAAEVLLLTADGPLRGVIDVMPPHVLTAEEKEKPLPMDKLFIDAGFTDEETASKRVPRGTAVSYAAPCFAMGENLLCGKSLDDRSCAAVLIRAMQLLSGRKLAVDVAVNLAAQEEVGGRGAVVGTYALAPEYALAVDVSFAREPGSPADKTFKIDCGALIGVGPAATRSVSDRLIALAEKKGIPFEIEVLGGHSGTDGDDILVSRSGVATGVVSLPLRYMHTPAEVIDLRSAEAVAELIAAWVGSFGEED